MPVPLTSDHTLQLDAAAFYEALSDLIRIYQFRDRDGICCFDLSVTQCYGLDAVVRAGSLTTNEIASRLYLDKSTVSRVVDTLVRKELVQRTRNADDGRSVDLTATARGRELHARITAGLIEREKGILADFDPDVRRGMIEIIAKLTQAAATRVDTTGGVCCCID